MVLKYAFDLHGTLDSKYSKDFREFIYKLKSFSNIYVLSGGNKQEIIQTLKRFNYDVNIFTEIISVQTELENMGVKHWIKENEKTGELDWYCNDNIWNAAKSIICENRLINCLVDNDLMYKVYFGHEHITKFILFENDILSVKQKIIKNLNFDLIFR